MTRMVWITSLAAAFLCWIMTAGMRTSDHRYTEKKGYATDNLLHFDLLNCSVS